jgi:hypothetical protein
MCRQSDLISCGAPQAPSHFDQDVQSLPGINGATVNPIGSRQEAHYGMSMSREAQAHRGEKSEWRSVKYVIYTASQTVKDWTLRRGCHIAIRRYVPLTVNHCPYATARNARLLWFLKRLDCVFAVWALPSHILLFPHLRGGSYDDVYSVVRDSINEITSFSGCSYQRRLVVY